MGVIKKNWGKLFIFFSIVSSLFFFQNCGKPVDIRKYILYSSLTPITSLFSTGLDNEGVALPPGSRDPHYQLVDENPAYILVHPDGWLSNDDMSGWIMPAANVKQYPGSYSLKTSFNLDRWHEQTAYVELRVSVDDVLDKILLNGNIIYDKNNSNIQFRKFTGFSDVIKINSGFIEGDNELEFLIINNGIDLNPVGLRVLASGWASLK